MDSYSQITLFSHQNIANSLSYTLWQNNRRLHNINSVSVTTPKLHKTGLLGTEHASNELQRASYSFEVWSSTNPTSKTLVSEASICAIYYWTRKTIGRASKTSEKLERTGGPLRWAAAGFYLCLHCYKLETKRVRNMCRKMQLYFFYTHSPTSCQSGCLNAISNMSGPKHKSSQNAWKTTSEFFKRVIIDANNQGDQHFIYVTAV